MGIDTGTQGVRVGVCDSRGSMKASAEEKWDTIYPQLGWAEQVPDHWWNAICDTVNKTLNQISVEERRKIRACTVCATSSTALPVNVDGEPLMNAMMWMDARSRDEMNKINNTKHEMLKYCGGSVSFEWLIPKVLWLKAHRPEIYKNAFRIVEQLDWINYKLTGLWVASKCNATCKWNYCDEAGGFSDDFFTTIGLPEYRNVILTDVRKMGEPIGPIRRELAEQFGLSSDLMIVQGGIDAHCALIGMNAFTDNRMGIIMGTSFVHLSQISEKTNEITGIWGPYKNPIEDGRWLLEGGQITAGALVNWFISNFKVDQGADGNIYDQLSQAAASIPMGSENVTVLDFFQGNRTPYKDADAKGVIYGLNIKHTWKHIYRAVLEGVAFGTRNIIDNQISQGYDVNLIVGCGGVTKDKVWMQIISDVTGKRIVVNENSQAGVLGDCVLAATGVGKYRNFEEAAEQMVHVKDSYIPDESAHKAYEKPYHEYLGLYQDLKKRMDNRN